MIQKALTFLPEAQALEDTAIRCWHRKRRRATLELKAYLFSLREAR